MRRDLRVQGKSVELEAKPWEVLHQLLLHAGEVVTKEELLDSVWPGLTVVDGSLATAISKLRKALGDDSLIVTLPRIGYRLAVPVQTTATATPESHELLLSPGQTVPLRDQWRLIRRLDRSPSSEVWLAEHPKTHECRVFKFASDLERLRALKREVTLARLLRDSLGERPDFVRVLEWNFEKLPYFVESEYVGPNLAEWTIQAGGLSGIPATQRLSLFVSIVQGVAAAHSLDVLHKDLKPGNILVSLDQEGHPQIKIADFGSATLLAPSRLGALGITNLGFTQPVAADQDSITGTAMYIAPELLAGQSPTAASDVYALGVLLYQLLAGDFRRPLAPGWEMDITDSLIRKDIGDAACGDPLRRIKTASELADRLTTLEVRRSESEAIARTEQNKRNRNRRLPLAIATAALVIVTAVLLRSIWHTPVATKEPRVKTIVVLPFRNIGSDVTVDYLRLALPDEISTTLSHTAGLAVRPSSTASKYLDSEIDLQRIGNEMGASTVVTGHFSKQAEQLHITIEAIDVKTNGVLWRDKVESVMPSMIAMQVQMNLRIKGGLSPALGLNASGDVGQPKNEEAYNLFLRSVGVAMEEKSVAVVIKMLERAVELDPNYAPAWLLLARYYYADSHYSKNNRGQMDRYNNCLQKALAADPDYVAAAAGSILSQVERGELTNAYKAAADLYKRRPDSVDAQFQMSYVFRYAGLLDEAATFCDQAFLTDAQTQTSGLRSCAVVFMLRGEYPRALNFINLDPDSEISRAVSLDMLARQNKKEDAVRVASSREPQWGGFDLLVAYLQEKSASDIRGMAAHLEPSEDPETNYFAAAHLAYVGETEPALLMLRAAIKGNYCSYPAMDTDPFFANLKTRPEFAELRKAGMQCQNEFVAGRGK